MFLISGLSVPIFFLLQESGRLQGEERANEGRIRRKGGGRKTTVSSVTIVCQYDLRRFDASTMLDLLLAHPSVHLPIGRVPGFYGR